jgi:thiol-disulfide isomerase/thioredoxin
MASADVMKSTGNTSKGTAVKAPGFAIKDLSGKTIKWSQFKGKVVLVDFWATWCGPCRRSIPHLSRLHTKYADKGFEVVGISLDQAGVAPVAKFAKDMGMPYTVLMGDIQLASDWGVGAGIPMAFLVDRQGNIVDRILGYQEASVFEGKIEKLL